MSWDDLRSELQWIGLHQSPAMILVHLGGNDVACTSILKWKRLMCRDMESLFCNFPETLIVWSDILPCLTWKFARPDIDLKVLNKKRIRFNLFGHQAVHELKNGRIRKHEISTDTPGLFLENGCHLSDVGKALFCNSIQGGIECFLTSAHKSFE